VRDGLAWWWGLTGIAGVASPVPKIEGAPGRPPSRDIAITWQGAIVLSAALRPAGVYSPIYLDGAGTSRLSPGFQVSVCPQVSQVSRTVPGERILFLAISPPEIFVTCGSLADFSLLGACARV
jgi:hypothetical protein